MKRFLVPLLVAIIALATPASAILHGGGGGSIQPLRSAVSRAMVGQQFASGFTAGFVQGQTRMRMYLGDGNLSELRVCYGNWAGPGEAPGPGNLVVEADLESDGPLGAHRFLWSGANSITLTPGQTACSDALLPASFGLTVFPANQPIWFRTGDLAVSEFGHPSSNLLSNAGESMWAGPVFTSQVNATGPMTTPAGGGTVIGGLTPFMVLGRYTVPMPTLCDIGDSISAGVNDPMSASTGALAGYGYVGRAAYNTYGDRIYPTFRMGIIGEGTTTGAGYAQRAAFFQDCTHGVVAWGTNDLSAGASAASVLANLEIAWNTMAADGIGSIWQALVIPRTTSTDGWVTTANQTPIANFGNGGSRDTLNTSITAAIGTNHLTGTLDFATATQATTDHSLWFVNGTFNFSTNDGIHPMSVAHAAMAPVLTAAVQSTGQQLPTQDTSWVPTGADWAADFKNGRYWHINCAAVLMCYPTQGANSGTARSSVGYGVTANNSTGVPIQFGPDTPRITPGRGLLAEQGATNLFATPFTPATQTVTVSSSTQYTASVTGTGSLVLSGACTGTVVAGTPVTCTTSSTSLVATVSGTLLSMQVETGALATTPISGTRAVEEVGFPSGGGTIDVFATTAGTIALSFEGLVPSGGNTPIFSAFGSGYLLTNPPTNIAALSSATIVGPMGSTANGHTVVGITWDATGRGIIGDAGTIVSDANPTGASGNQVYLGGEGVGGGDSKLNSYVQMIWHYPGRLTAATSPTFQQATTP